MRNYITKANEGGLPDSITANKLGAGEANSFLTENETAVSSSGQTLAPADGAGESTDQLAKALAIYGAGGAEYCLDTGAVNAYILSPVSPKKSIPAYFDGMTISFCPGSENTGNSTVNYASLGVKNIRKVGGGNLNAGDISCTVTIRYVLSSDRFEIISNVPVNIVLFTSSGSYSKPAGLKFIEVQAVGGGGGGGGSASTTASEASIGKGGSGGGYAIKNILASALSSSETVTIGAAGTGGAAGNNSGTDGGDTSFGAHCQGDGGLGGFGGAASSGNDNFPGQSGGAATGGDINVTGGYSPPTSIIGGVRGSVGNGGISLYSAGGLGAVNANGNAAQGYGGGGGGGSNGPSAGTKSGGDGAQGIVIIKEYF